MPDNINDSPSAFEGSDADDKLYRAQLEIIDGNIRTLTGIKESVEGYRDELMERLEYAQGKYDEVKQQLDAAEKQRAALLDDMKREGIDPA